MNRLSLLFVGQHCPIAVTGKIELVALRYRRLIGPGRWYDVPIKGFISIIASVGQGWAIRQPYLLHSTQVRQLRQLRQLQQISLVSCQLYELLPGSRFPDIAVDTGWHGAQVPHGTCILFEEDKEILCLIHIFSGI